MKIKNLFLNLLVVAFCLALSACKLEITVEGEGNVTSLASVPNNNETSIDCSNDGTTQSGDCFQEYVTDLSNCSLWGNLDGVDQPGDSRGIEDDKLWGDVNTNDIKDAGEEFTHCWLVSGSGLAETYVATPTSENEFNGWAGDCVGGSACDHTISTADASSDHVRQVTASFGSSEELAASASYTYNYRWQRASKTVNGVTTYFLYDEEGLLLQEYIDIDNTVTYIYMDGELNSIIEKIAGTEVAYYAVNDHLGQPQRLVNWAGILSYERYATPFGENFSTYKDSSLGAQNLRFPGQYYDKETSLNQNWHRDYDAVIGRYIQPDPLGLFDGPNTYLYAHANPVMEIDSRGLATQALGYGLGRLAMSGANRLAIHATGLSATTLLLDQIANDPLEDGWPETDTGEEECADECDPPAGTQCYQMDSGHSHKGLDPHYHIWQMNRAPDGRCFWNKKRGAKDTFASVPLGLQPCSSYASWLGQ